MGAGWVAGSVRARLLARHRLGTSAAHEVADCSVEEARSRLTSSPYARSVAGATSVRDAQRAIWTSALWDIRVLAGWLPPSGVEAARTFAGYFEIQNFEARLAVRTDDQETPFDLGGLATTTARAGTATSASQLRDELRRSRWRDPGTEDPAGMLLCIRIEWARRLAEIAPAETWGLGAAALIAARAMATRDERVNSELARRIPSVGRRLVDAMPLAELVAALPSSAGWVLEGIERPEDIWRAEARWWQRVDRDGERLLHSIRPGLDVAVGAVAVRMADAWRVAAALDIASRGGLGREVLDAVA